MAVKFPSRLNRVAIAASALVIGAASVHAAEAAQISNPITVKPGEELRIMMFNPDNEPVALKVFAFNTVENNYDEGPLIVLPPGRMRFLDFKLSREFVGFAGVIEMVPDDAAGAVARATAASASPKLRPEQILAVTHTFRSKSSMQHRGLTGQSQTLGWGWGANGPAGFARPPGIPASAALVSRSAWQASPE